MSSEQLQKTTANELHAIARRINDRVSVIEQLTAKTGEAACATVAEAVLQGQDLLRAKAIVPHGLWLDWLAANCPRVSRITAWKYMHLASNVNRLTNEAGSIREALRLLAKDSEQKTASTRNTDRTVDYLEGLDRILKWTKFIRDHPLTDWPPEGIDKARHDLEPTARLLWPDKFEA